MERSLEGNFSSSDILLREKRAKYSNLCPGREDKVEKQRTLIEQQAQLHMISLLLRIRLAIVSSIGLRYPLDPLRVFLQCFLHARIVAFHQLLACHFSALRELLTRGTTSKNLLRSLSSMRIQAGKEGLGLGYTAFRARKMFRHTEHAPARLDFLNSARFTKPK